MPILIAALGIAVAAFFFIQRARNAADAASDIIDMANDVRLAARRFGFKRKANVHPVEQIDDPRVALAALIRAFMEEQGMPTQDLHIAYLRALQNGLKFTLEEAEEAHALAGWLIANCNGASPAVSRLTRRLFKLSGSEAIGPVLGMLDDIYVDHGVTLNDSQQDSIEQIKRGLQAT